MVCDRCTMLVRKIFNDFKIKEIELGKVSVLKNLSFHQEKIVYDQLEKSGFEVLADKNSIIINNIKSIIIDHLQSAEPTKLEIKDLIESKLNYSYAHLSRLFSKHEGNTIKKFFINQQILKAQELLSYDEQSIKQITFQAGFNSVAHFSRTFKRYCGVSPSHFKTRSFTRIPLDKSI